MRSIGVSLAVSEATRLRANRVAFQILLEKLRPRSNFADEFRAKGAASVGTVRPDATPYAETIVLAGSPGDVCTGAATTCPASPVWGQTMSTGIRTS